MGFFIDDCKMKWVGLDYWDKLEIYFYESLEDFMFQMKGKFYLIFKFVEKVYFDVDLLIDEDYYFFFGCEDKGLFEDFMCEYFEKVFCIFMNDEYVCSFNVFNIVCMIVYEVFCQQNFVGFEFVYIYEVDKLK